MELLFFLAFVWFVIYLVRRSGSDNGPGPSAPQQRTPRPEGVARSSQTRSADPPRESEACWVPAGQSVEVAGHRFSSGMVYVGRQMGSLRWRGEPDPALIDPSLRVADGGSRSAGAEMDYWPSYSKVTPSARAGYLKWLQGGRRDPDAYIGYVFLFFYGIERRVLHDAQHSSAAATEVPALVQEVKDLLRVYGSNSSFRGYATRFLDLVEVTQGSFDTARVSPPLRREGWELPIRLQLGLGAMVKAGEPIPPIWALSWLRCHPEMHLRTPAKRCREEFDRLFQIRYRERFGEGMRIPPNKSRLSVSYRPASSSFAGPAEISGHDLPDVTKLSAPVRRFMELADAVQDELDSYSRWVGRNDDRSSPAALALLPAELVGDRMGSEAEALVALIDDRMGGDEVAIVPTSALVAHFPSKDPEKLTKKERCMLADFLSGLGYGIEPDARYGGANLSRVEHAAVFRLGGADAAPGEAFDAACALLHLGAAVAASDDEVTAEEERHLEEHLEQSLDLQAPDRRRLRAHLRWLLTDPPGVRGLKKKMEELPASLRRDLGRFVISVAGADGHVSPDELRMLSKIYPILGLDASLVYSDVHAVAAPGPDREAGPVTVLPADAAADGFAIRKPPQERRETGVGAALTLDPAKVAAIREQTKAATEVLGAIFAGEEEQAEDQDEELAAGGDAASGESIGGLDPQHSALVRQLMDRDEWPRSEFEKMAEEHGLLSAGAIEVINEASFDVCGEPMLEGHDPIEVNSYAVEEMLA